MKANGDFRPDFSGPIFTSSQEKIQRLQDIPNIQTLEIPPIEYLVPGMIARNTITLWTGADGTAKTLLAQNMAVAVASGTQFLGLRCQQSSVLYLDYENPSYAVRDRLDLITGEQAVESLHIWGTWLEQQPPQIGSELILTIAKESKPLIFVDPFRYSHSAEENDSTEMMVVMQQLRYCAAVGGAVVILHHPAKSEGSTGRGSSAIKGAADVAFLQEMDEESGLITLKCIKNRFGEKQAVTIRPNYQTGKFEVTDSPQFTKRKADLEKIEDIICRHPGIGQNEICRQSGMMKARCIELLKSGSHLWEAHKDGRSVRYFSSVLKTQNRSQNYRTDQGKEDGSTVLTLYGENREPIPNRNSIGSIEAREPITEKLCAVHGFHVDWFLQGKVWLCAKSGAAA
jgi:hypothetical protein